MKFQSFKSIIYSRLLHPGIIMLALLLSGCNDDVFVDPIETGSDWVALDQAGEEVTIDVKGTNWRILDVHSGRDHNAGYDGGNIYFIDSPMLALSIKKTGEHSLRFKLAYNITGEALGFYVTVGNEYEERVVNFEVGPTGRLEFIGIDYVLDSWSEYPFGSNSDNLETYIYQGVDKSPYIFRPIITMPVVYKFEPFYSDDREKEIATAACDLGTEVPVPSPTGKFDPTWALMGDKITLDTEQTAASVSHFVKPQESIEIPTGVPIEISRWCDYMTYGFQCTITVRNPVTEEETPVLAKLLIHMPEKIYATYTLL